MKRSLVYILVAGALVVVALVIFFAFFANKSPAAPAATTGVTGSLPTTNLPANNGAANGGATGTGAQGGNANGASPAALPAAAGGQTLQGLGLLSNELALNYFVTASNTVLMAEPDGKIEQISGGQSSYLSADPIKNVLSAEFSYDGKKVLVSFGDPQSPQWSLFDTVKKSWSVAPVSPVVAAWSPANYQIAYFTPVGGGWALETIDLSVSKAKPRILLSLPGEDFRIIWKAPSDILLADRANALFSGSVMDFNLKTNALLSVIQSRVGLETQWNSATSMAVVLAGTPQARGGTLGIVDRNGNLLHQLTFLTLPSKCVFNDPAPVAPAKAPAKSSSSTVVAPPSASTLICAIPRDSAKLTSSPLPDAYDERAILTADDFFRVNLTSGDISSVFGDPSQILDASVIKIFNNTLFFINRYDNKLYALPLPQ